MRKLAKIFLIVLALLLIVVLAIPFVLDVNRYRGRIEAQLEQRLGRDVSLGEMRLSLLPFAITAENVAIAEDPRFGNTLFAKAEELHVESKLLPLLRGEVEIVSLEMQKPVIELIRNNAGTWNFSTIGSKQQPQTAGAPQQPAPAPQPGEQPTPKDQQQQLSLSSLRIVDGQVAITDHQKKAPRAVYNHIDLSLDDFAPGKSFDLEATAHLPGEGEQYVKIDGQGGPMADNLLLTPFDGDIELREASLSAIQSFLNSQALAGMEAVASGSAKVKNEAGKLASSGSLTLQNARVRKTEIGYPLSLDYDISHDLNADLLEIQKGELKLGKTPLNIAGTVNLQPTPSQLELDIKASDVSIEEAARLAAAFGVAFNPGTKIAGRMSADLKATGATNKPAMNGSLSGRNLEITGQDLKQPVRIAAIELAMTPQSIRSNDFAAATGKTTVTAQMTLNNYAGANPVINGSIRTNDAELGEVLSIAKAYGVEAANGMSGTGGVSLNVHVAGPTKRMSALNLSGSGKLSNATLNMPTLRKPLSVKNADLKFTQNSVVMQNVVATLGSTNATGNMTLRDFDNPKTQFSLAADKLDAAEWQQMIVVTPAAPARAAAFSIIPAAHAQAPATQEPSFISQLTGSGTITVGTILYNELTLRNANADVNLERGIIRLSPVTTELYGGQQRGTIVVNTRTTPTTYVVDSRMDKVDANKLVSSVSSLRETIFGLLAANANTQFSTAENQEIARSLNGQLALNLRNGRIAGVDMLNGLASVGKFLGLTKNQDRPFTDILAMTGDFDVRNGVAQTNNLRATTDFGTLAGTGSVNLVSQGLDLQITAVLNDEFSKKVGGTNVGGYMTTALANRDGQLVLPVLVTGTFNAPRFAPNVQMIAKMKLENLAPTLSNPGSLKGGLGDIIGALGGKKPQTTDEEQSQPQSDDAPQQEQPKSESKAEPQKTEDVVGDILGGLLGGSKKKKQQPAQTPPPAEQQEEQPPDQPR